METFKITRGQILELASELAHDRMIDNLFKDETIFSESQVWFEDENGTEIYTEVAQEEFNNCYSYYLTRIENILTEQ